MSGSLETLLAEGIITDVVARLKSGKEADVYVVAYQGRHVAAKVYKDHATRSFKNNASYKEGRSVRSSRSQRAIDKGSRFGRDAAEDAWKSAEVDALYKLHAGGVRVPTPVLFFEGVLLMELVLDPEGAAARRVIDVQLTVEEARTAYHDMLGQLVRILCCDLIHGDLSPYNVLWGVNGPTIIDFPQAVSAPYNSRAEFFFIRDAHNILGHFAAVDRSLDARFGDAAEIWRAYTKRELTQDFLPRGRPMRPAFAPRGPRAPIAPRVTVATPVSAPPSAPPRDEVAPAPAVAAPEHRLQQPPPHQAPRHDAPRQPRPFEQRQQHDAPRQPRPFEQRQQHDAPRQPRPFEQRQHDAPRQPRPFEQRQQHDAPREPRPFEQRQHDGPRSDTHHAPTSDQDHAPRSDPRDAPRSDPRDAPRSDPRDAPRRGPPTGRGDQGPAGPRPDRGAPRGGHRDAPRGRPQGERGGHQGDRGSDPRGPRGDRGGSPGGASVPAPAPRHGGGVSRQEPFEGGHGGSHGGRRPAMPEVIVRRRPQDIPDAPPAADSHGAPRQGGGAPRQGGGAPRQGGGGPRPGGGLGGIGGGGTERPRRRR